MQKTQHNKAKKDKMSILADAKELLRVLIPAVQHLPKIERIEGAPMEMKKAAFGLIGSINPEWFVFVHWNTRRQCMQARPGFTLRDRLNRKYHLKLKRHDKRRKAAAA